MTRSRDPESNERSPLAVAAEESCWRSGDTCPGRTCLNPWASIASGSLRVAAVERVIGSQARPAGRRIHVYARPSEATPADAGRAATRRAARTRGEWERDDGGEEDTNGVLETSQSRGLFFVSRQHESERSPLFFNRIYIFRLVSIRWLAPGDDVAGATAWPTWTASVRHTGRFSRGPAHDEVKMNLPSGCAPPGRGPSSRTQ